MEGCRAAGITKQCFFKWLKEEAFRDEYLRIHGAIAHIAFETVRRSAAEAAERLTGMMDVKSGPLL